MNNIKLSILLAFYVNNFLIVVPLKSIIFDIENKFLAYFKFKYIGEVKTFLGFDILRNREEKIVFVNYVKYTAAIIKKFGYNNLYRINIL